jgi:hypothetical protein
MINVYLNVTDDLDDAGALFEFIMFWPLIWYLVLLALYLFIFIKYKKEYIVSLFFIFLELPPILIYYTFIHK